MSATPEQLRAVADVLDTDIYQIDKIADLDASRACCALWGDDRYRVALTAALASNRGVLRQSVALWFRLEAALAEQTERHINHTSHWHADDQEIRETKQLAAIVRAALGRHH